ncbi:MAG: thiamine pyrophosphate-binding protein [Gammaproteobacteria bacterium]|jgi:acetolactate synthase I/II/III large subunit|nr:thiamine pyrophosphate-binding protein [Gammaproteobacteria bacterium]
MRTGAQILADILVKNDSRFVFHMPGESFLIAIDALHQHAGKITAIACRNETGMAIMAEATGKLTDKPGICFVTRGPGGTNVGLGMHTALQDSSPMILFVGQAGRFETERDTFLAYQDFPNMFAPLAKWVVQVDSAHRLPEIVSRAYHVAMSGRPGPVVVVIPEDVFEEECDVKDAMPVQKTEASPAQQDVEKLMDLLGKAKKPVLFIGGTGWTETARTQVQDFAEKNKLPVVSSFRRRDVIDNRHPCFVGELGIGANPNLLPWIKESDLIIAFGLRLGEMNTIGSGFMIGFSLFDVPVPEQTLIQIHSGLEELNRVYQADLAILSSPVPMAAALEKTSPLSSVPWQERTSNARVEYETYGKTDSCPEPVDLAAIFRWLRDRLSGDAILTNGAGTYAGWSQRYFQHYQLHTQLGPISGGMGYGLPAAIAAKLHRPESPVIALAGDGCFLMNSEELATAVKYQIPIIILVINNNMYGAIRMHQEIAFGGRDLGTSLTNPDFSMLAKAYGISGAVVSTTDEFEPAFEQALKSEGPAIIELRINPEAINTRFTLSSISKK